MPRRNAPENFFPPRYGAAHGHAQEPTPGSAVEFWCARTNPWVRGRKLPVPGQGGGGICPMRSGYHERMHGTIARYGAKALRKDDMELEEYWSREL